MTTWLYSFIPLVTYIVGITGAFISGGLVYAGLSTKLERRHYRLRLKENWNDGKRDFIQSAKKSKTEQILAEARYPLKLTAIRIQILSLFFICLLVINYLIYPVIRSGQPQIVGFIAGLVVILLFYPGVPFSFSRFLLKRVVEYRRAKQSAELFSLYDMIVSEIEMMKTTRVNVYNLLRALLPYFKELHPIIARLLSDWSTSSKGPQEAIDNFANELGTTEAKSLGTVLKTFDENSRETLLESLRGMEDMFVTSQIENNRRKRKLYLDLASLPVKVANFLILLNFILVIVTMVMVIMDSNHVNL